MTISERLLRRWRRDALREVAPPEIGPETVEEPRSELLRKVLLMTSELLDLHLLRK